MDCKYCAGAGVSSYIGIPRGSTRTTAAREAPALRLRERLEDLDGGLACLYALGGALVLIWIWGALVSFGVL